jgi:signal transduction histidine kinase
MRRSGRPSTVEGMEALAYAAHELRAPLATQRALLELALADPHADVAMWREVGADVLDECHRQERLLEACLALARGEDGPRRREPVDLAAITGDALRSHDRCSIETAVALEPAWTTGDSRLLECLVANVVSNAIRHNLPDGTIQVATRMDSGHAVLSVSNSGPLIPAKELPRLFRPFERLGSRANGVGLGLAIVQAIADAHGAAVTARAPRSGGLAIQVAFAALA